MSVAAARPAVVGVAMRATDGAATAAVPTAVLSRREAGLRSAATSCMALVALVQTVALPSLFGQGALYVALSGSAAALCIAMGLALAAAPAGPGRHVWRLVAATATLLLAGWAVPRIVALPGPAGTRGLWGPCPVPRARRRRRRACCSHWPLCGRRAPRCGASPRRWR